MHNKDLFEEKIQPVLQYIGAIGATLMSVAYIVIVCVMINGFQYQPTQGSLTFAVINAAVGLVIMQFLKVQGIAFAENDKENIEITKQYFNTKTKDKKPHSLVYYWLTSGLKDLLTKGCTLAFTTFGLVYIVIEGSHDYNLLLLAFVNLLMFICFGLLALNNAYRYYYNSYIPYIKEQLKEKKDGSNN